MTLFGSLRIFKISKYQLDTYDLLKVRMCVGIPDNLGQCSLFFWIKENYISFDVQFAGSNCFFHCLPVVLHTTVVLIRASAFSKVMHFGHSVSTKQR